MPHIFLKPHSTHVHATLWPVWVGHRPCLRWQPSTIYSLREWSVSCVSAVVQLSNSRKCGFALVANMSQRVAFTSRLTADMLARQPCTPMLPCSVTSTGKRRSPAEPSGYPATSPTFRRPSRRHYNPPSYRHYGKLQELSLTV